MFDGDVFTVFAVNGSFIDVCEPGTNALRFDGLTWPDAVELARLSFEQGFEIVIWRMPEGGDDGQEECAVSEKTV